MKTTMSEPKRSLRRRLAMAVAILSLLSSFVCSQFACLPHPTSVQLGNIYGCGNAQTILTQGSFDTSVLLSYNVVVDVYNFLSINGDTGLLRPDTNTVRVREVKVWFEYPSNFSLQGAGAALYTEQSPKIYKTHFIIPAQVEADLQGITGGQGGGTVQVTPTKAPVPLVPFETASLWDRASELKSLATGNQFVVIAHFSMVAESLTGAVLKTEELPFRLTVCKGCHNKEKAEFKNVPKSCLTTIASDQTGQGAECIGQNGTCVGAATP